MEILCELRSMSVHNGASYLQLCDGSSSCMSAGSLSNLFSCGSSLSRPRAGRWRRQRRCSMARMPSKRSYNRQRLVKCATVPRSKNRVHDAHDTRLCLSHVCALSSLLVTFRLASYSCIFFLLRIFVAYYRRPLVSSYFPLAMSLNMHLCTIHPKKSERDDVGV